jgi:hypothetical protein
MPAQFVEIPDIARAAKPMFTEQPGAEIVQEIRDWVKSGNPSWAWRGHTHTKPAQDSVVVYINDFQLPKGRLTPCPCCWPSHEKFRGGMIGWFPGESVIRLIGPGCFASINKEGHEAALRELRGRQHLAASIIFLGNNRDAIPVAIARLARAHAVAEHIDSLQEFFASAERRTTAVPDLWQHIRNEGALHVVDRELIIDNRPSRNDDDEDDAKDRYRMVDRVLTRVDGYRLIDPLRKPLATRLDSARRRLAAIRIPDLDDEADHVTLGKLVSGISRAVRDGQDAIGELNDVVRFLTPTSLASIRTWGSHKTAPLRYYINRDGDSLLVGQTAGRTRRIDLPSDVGRQVSNIPDLTIESEIQVRSLETTAESRSAEIELPC